VKRNVVSLELSIKGLMDVDSSGNDNRGKTATRRRRNLFGSNNDCNNSTLEQ